MTTASGIASLDGFLPVAGLAAAWFVQSLVLAAVGLLLAAAARRWGAAAQSAIYRATLAAVLAAPVVSVAFSSLGVGGWSIPLASLGIGTNQVPQDDRAQETVRTGLDPSERRLGSLDGAGAATPRFDDQPGNTVRAEEHTAQDFLRSGIRTGPSLERGAAGPVAGLLGILWLLAAASGLARLAWSWRAMRSICRGSVAVDRGTAAVAEDLARTLGIPCPELRRSPFVTSPCVIGVWRPTILLSEEASLSVADVLVHELAHVARRDGLWNLLRHVATACLFPQPLVWVLSRRIETTAEEICDDLALHFGADRVQYAEQLCNLAALSLPVPVSAAVAMKSSRTMLARRVGRILDGARPLSTGLGVRSGAAVVAAAAGMTLLAGLVDAGATPRRPASQGAPAPSQSAPAAREPTVALVAAGDDAALDAAAADKKADELLRGRLYARGYKYENDQLKGMALVAIDPNTGQWTRLVENSDSANLAVTPDGKTIVYGHESALWSGDTESNANPGKIHAEGGRVVFSPDGRSMILTTWRRRADDPEKWESTVSKITLDGQPPSPLPWFDGSSILDWSADGRRLLVHNGETISVVGLDGKDPKTILGRKDHHAYFSPDSRRVVYSHGWKGAIHTIGVDGADDKLLYHAPDLTNVHLGRFSPDGKRIVAALFRLVLGNDGKTPVQYADPKVSNPRLVLIDAATGDERPVPLPQQDGWDFYPTDELDWR